MINYILLGVAQGIFEWLPISSEGVVALFSQLLESNINPVDVALFLHIGTLFAAGVYFAKDWWSLLTLKRIKFLKFLFIATLISLVVGFPIYKIIRSVAVGSVLLAITGVALLLTAFFQKKNYKIKIKGNKLSVLVGFLQGLAVVPGLSRSGATIFGLSLGNLKNSEILKVSYMMSVPVVLASSTYLFLENPNLASKAWPALIASFLVGVASLHFLIKLSQRISFLKFAIGFSLLCFLGAGIGFVI